MNGQAIIDKAGLYTDDTTELSTQEALDVLNDKYHAVCDDRDWLFLKKSAEGTMVTTTTITLPSDFASVLENMNATDNSTQQEFGARPVIIFLGILRFQLINWSDRKRYEDRDGYCYLDIPNNVIVFTVAQSGLLAYQFDYKFVPTDLTLTTSPLFPTRFHSMLQYALATDEMVIQLFPQNRSNEPANEIRYQKKLSDMALWDANLQMD